LAHLLMHRTFIVMSASRVGPFARLGKAVSMGGFAAIFKISLDPSEARFSIVEHPIDPGRMVHTHVHAHEDEFSYILEGEIGASVGDQVLQATTGSYVFLARRPSASLLVLYG
jgi:quercetin dioxygenase-like cupin family protein